MWIGSFKYDGHDVYFGTTSSGGTTRLCRSKDEAAMVLADLENEDGKDFGVAEVYALEVVPCQRQLRDSADIVERCIILRCLIPGKRVTYRVYLETGFLFLAEATDLVDAIGLASDYWEP